MNPALAVAVVGGHPSAPTTLSFHVVTFLFPTSQGHNIDGMGIRFKYAMTIRMACRWFKSDPVQHCVTKYLRTCNAQHI